MFKNEIVRVNHKNQKHERKKMKKKARVCEYDDHGLHAIPEWLGSQHLKVTKFDVDVIKRDNGFRSKYRKVSGYACVHVCVCQRMD